VPKKRDNLLFCARDHASERLSVVALGALLGYSSQSADAPGIKFVDQLGREFMHLTLAEVGDKIVATGLDIVCVGSLPTT